jgi:hypothetical protein
MSFPNADTHTHTHTHNIHDLQFITVQLSNEAQRTVLVNILNFYRIKNHYSIVYLNSTAQWLMLIPEPCRNV